MRRLVALALLCALPVLAGTNDTTLLGLCSELSSATCQTQTSWQLQETTSTPAFIGPAGANASFQITVTEGATTRTLTLSDLITLDGLIASGTDIAAIFLSVQKGDGQGGYTTVASAAVGDPTNACGCPYVPSSMVLTASAGSTPLASTPLLTVASGVQQQVTLSANWNLSQGLIQPGDALRIQPCVAYSQARLSATPGCYANGGNVHAVKACTGMSLAACTSAPRNFSKTRGSEASDSA